MSELIKEQGIGFFIMFFCGVGIAIFRQLFIIYKNEFMPGVKVIFVQEVLFWLVSAILASAFLYYASYGEITFQSAAAFTLGVLLWYNICKHRNKKTCGKSSVEAIEKQEEKR
jgi:hypothetical protein